MNWLADSAALGSLEIAEVWVDYDGPRVFTCRSETDQYFIVGWADEAEDSDLWLYLPVSQHRLVMVRSGSLGLARAFAEPEGAVYSARLYYDGGRPDEVSILSPSEMLEEWLPEAGFRINLPTPTHAAAVSRAEVERLARAEGRTRIRLEIDDRSVMRTEARTRRVASVLSAAQNVLDNFGLVELETEPAQDGRFARLVQEKMDTDVVELAAASFVIELGSRDTEDLLGDSPIAKVAEKMVAMLSLQSTPDELWTQLTEVKPRAARSFRSFVGELASFGSDVLIASASTALSYKEQRLTSDQVANLHALLKEILPDEVQVIRGRMVLFSGDSQRRTFGLRDVEGATFEGRVGERAASSVEHATLGELYDVEISEYASFDRGAGESKSRFVLEQLTDPDGDAVVATTYTKTRDTTSILRWDKS